jgi:hypothetical protein
VTTFWIPRAIGREIPRKIPGYSDEIDLGTKIIMYARAGADERPVSAA